MSSAELVQVLVDEKQGIPPEVPATVSAGVVVGLATEMSPPVKLTLETPPPPPLYCGILRVLVDFV